MSRASSARSVVWRRVSVSRSVLLSLRIHKEWFSWSKTSGPTLHQVLRMKDQSVRKDQQSQGLLDALHFLEAQVVLQLVLFPLHVL